MQKGHLVIKQFLLMHTLVSMVMPEKKSRNTYMWQQSNLQASHTIENVYFSYSLSKKLHLLHREVMHITGSCELALKT